MKQYLNTIGLVALIMSISLWLFINNHFENKAENNRAQFQNLKIEGVVIDTYTDFENKGKFTVGISNYDKDTLWLTEFYKTGIYFSNLFSIGDSVYKEPESIDFKIYRGKKLIYDGGKQI